MAKLDITRTNDAVTRLLEVTENPRHRYMLLTYYRHRFLEIAGFLRSLGVTRKSSPRP
jgi:hypothetical protein